MSALHSSPYMKNHESVPRMMVAVIFTLIPGILVYVHFFGHGILINILLAVITAIACEAAVLKLRHRPVKYFLLDGSAVLTAILLAISIPPLAPWWLIVIGTAFAIVIAKHLYGGTGYNPFNPAMAGFAMLLVSFPREMTAWIPALSHGLDFTDFLRYSLTETLPKNSSYDAITMATPLDTVKTSLNMGFTLDEVHSRNEALFGNMAGRGWEWINILFMIGGIILIAIRVISWHIPVSMLAALSFMAMIFHFSDADSFAPVSFHLFSGATMLGAFFIATDPVTAAASTKGRLIYGAGIGILIYIIRTWGGYPDAIAFSVLLMNMTAPMIDYYFKPAVFGATDKSS